MPEGCKHAHQAQTWQQGPKGSSGALKWKRYHVMTWDIPMPNNRPCDIL
jgi:hypothetical protein